MKTLLRIIVGCGIGCIVLTAGNAQGSVILRDSVSNPALWNGQNVLPGYTDPIGGIYSSVGIQVRGNGQKVDRIGYIGAEAPGTLPISATEASFALYTSTADYMSDPGALNRPAGWKSSFILSVNPDVMTQIGSNSFGYRFFYAEYDLSALNWNLGMNQDMVIGFTRGFGYVACALGAGTGSGAGGSDCYRAYATSGYSFGPVELQSVIGSSIYGYAGYQISGPNVGVRVTTVPTPGSLAIAGLGAFVAFRRRR